MLEDIFVGRRCIDSISFAGSVTLKPVILDEKFEETVSQAEQQQADRL